MPAAKYDFIMEQGSTFLKTITWQNSTGSPVDLTNYTATMMIRRDDEDGSVLASMSSTGSTIVLGSTSGTIQLIIPATSTAVMSAGRAVYDLEMSSGSITTKLLKGTIKIEREVTR